MTWATFLARLAELDDRLAIRRSVVLFVTLWMTWRAFDWAGQFAYVAMVKADGNLMLAAAGLVAAVTAPIAYLQKVVFDAYIAAKAPTA